jgi:hypothetical protein
MGPLLPNELQDIVERSEIARKYNAPLDPQSAYEILGGKIASAASPEQAQRMAGAARRTFTPGATTSRSSELDAALGNSDQSAAPRSDVPYPPPVAPASEKNVLGEIFGSSIARSVIRSVAVNVTGTLTRSLLGAMGVRGRRR